MVVFGGAFADDDNFLPLEVRPDERREAVSFLGTPSGIPQRPDILEVQDKILALLEAIQQFAKARLPLAKVSRAYHNRAGGDGN